VPERRRPMNALRTIQAKEEESRMRRLMKRGPHRGRNVPSYPPRFPLPFKPRPPLVDGYVYVIYRGVVFAYGRISQVRRHGGTHVGTRKQPVRAGYKLCIKGPLKRFPFTLGCKGFRRLRYSPRLLHRLKPSAARRLTTQLGLAP
jgi:hypothetical protein